MSYVSCPGYALRNEWYPSSDKTTVLNVIVTEEYDEGFFFLYLEGNQLSYEMLGKTNLESCNRRTAREEQKIL